MFNRQCIICGSDLDLKYPLCRLCMPKPLNKKDCCFVCGLPTSGFVDTCPHCREKEYLFKSNYSFFHYSSTPKLIINQYKFKGELSFKFYYSELIRNYLKEHFENPVLCPIPTSFLKRKIKKWYQLDPIVKVLQRQGVAVNNLLVKSFSRTQKKLNRSERENNLKGKFKVKKHRFMQDRDIVLLDDVYTTGATTACCASVLYDIGYKNIYVLTICRD